MHDILKMTIFPLFICHKIKTVTMTKKEKKNKLEQTLTSRMLQQLQVMFF